MKIAVVYDEPLSGEKQDMVSAVCSALNIRYEASPLPFDENFIHNVKTYDFVFNLSTGGGKYNKQVHVPALLDRLGIPFTGSSAGIQALCMDKSLTKLVLRENSIPTPSFIKFHSPKKLRDPGFYPAFVKPSREGSAAGISEKSCVNNFDELKEQVRYVFEEFGDVIVEEFIDGREFTVGIIGNGDELEVLPILEIDFSMLPDGLERYYSYRVKHHYAEETKYICPARITPDEERRLKDYSRKAFKALGLFDYARMDVRMKNGEFYIIEVNSLPLLVPVYSDLTKMLEPVGLSYDDLILKIFEAAKRRVERSR
ncbi:D-alanine--D-alanine ligase family protein [Kosmotoga pacifica]|uniref:D-alanine--D-alanine ligase n=1 Tax=Kosmotoga pacifica TaxID=1330330 RepID=A0A0G2ZBS9_9BACT|nr:ATP-grasp domain-containing protein [Kosmotoga pacifica]AKI97531.1 D-alanine--D-alanine ligase [Kosmotoga pacifica]